MSEFKSEFAEFAVDAVFVKPEFVKLPINTGFIKSEHSCGAIKVQYKFSWLSRAIPFSTGDANNSEPRGGGKVAFDKRDFRARKSVRGG